jgi:class 3 adenylate cyclase
MITYAIAAWAIVEGTSLMVDTFEAPEIITRLVILAAIAGFPIAFVIGWIFDITMDGVSRTEDELSSQSPAPRLKNKLRKANVAVIACIPVQRASALDPEELIELRDRAVQTFVDTVRDFGGIPLTESSPDYKAIFGYPKQGRDYLERALKCSLALATEVMEVVVAPGDINSTQPSIGLHAGEVLVPSRGGKAEELQAHAILGVTGRQAERIANLAPAGRVAVSDSFKQAMPAIGSLEELPGARDENYSEGVYLL